jgi:hypothetical protein
MPPASSWLTEHLSELDTQFLAQVAFLVAIFALLLNARLLYTGSHEASALDGLYAPMLAVIATFVLVYMSGISIQRFVGNSVLFTVALSVLVATKYEFLKGGDVNYMYRIISTVVDASSFSAIFDLPSSLVGIYPNFPGFVLLNVAFVKVTGVSTLEGYKFLFPVIFGILYPASFYLLSGLVTDSKSVKRGIVMAAVIPYALLPGAPWNYFMMPNYFAFLLFLVALALVLRRARPQTGSQHAFVIVLLTLLVVMAVTHPLASLYTAIVFTGLLAVKIFLAKTSNYRPSNLLTGPLVIFTWIIAVGWTVYSNPVQPYFQSAATVALLAFLEGFRVPSVTQRLGTSGPLVFLITHISKLALGGLALVGLGGLVKRKIPETKIDAWVTAVSIVLFSTGVFFFAAGYTFYDIYVGYRSLFLSITVLTIGSGLGLATLAVWANARPHIRGHFRLRKFALSGLLILILTVSLFELYPTEYVNPSLENSVHTIYERDTINFLNRHWATSSQILMNTLDYQVAQSFGSLTVFANIIPIEQVQYHRLRNPLTTLIDGRDIVANRSNIIYSSGFIMVNSTLR